MQLASANAPWESAKATTGLYDTHFRPGYDRSRWTLREYVQPSSLGDTTVDLLGWRLDRKPGSSEQEHAWFGFAERGGNGEPMLAVHMLTFEKGTDDLAGHTPPMDEVLPRWEALSRTLRMNLDN